MPWITNLNTWWGGCVHMTFCTKASKGANEYHAALGTAVVHTDPVGLGFQTKGKIMWCQGRGAFCIDQSQFLLRVLVVAENYCLSALVLGSIDRWAVSDATLT